MCYDDTGDQNHSGGFPQSRGTVASVVIEGFGLQKAGRESFNPFYKSHCCSRGGEKSQAFRQWKKACVTWQFVYSACVSYSSKIPVFPLSLPSLEAECKLRRQTPSFRSASFSRTGGSRATGCLSTSPIPVYVVKMQKNQHNCGGGKCSSSGLEKPEITRGGEGGGSSFSG